MTTNNSYFDGKLIQLIGWSLLGGLLMLVTFGLAYPWVLCMVYGWKVNHTVVEGRRLVFRGTGGSLFGHWIVWMLLCIITLGIYGFWLVIALEEWKAKNTYFLN